MENEKKTFVDWIKAHKKELIIAGVSIVAIIAAVIGIKNHKDLEKAWASLRKIVEKTPKTIPVKKTVPVTGDVPVKKIVDINIIPAEKVPHDVVEHLRNLPEGWRASEQKIATAAEHGYNLLPGQTWVESYKTGGVAA